MIRLPVSIFALIGLLQIAPLRAFAADYFVYFGSQSTAPGIGISLAHFDTDTGVLTTPKFILPADGPSFFALAPDHQHLYSTSYTGTGGVISYQINPQDGSLKQLNHISGNGAGASHISLDATGHFALEVNFDHGHVAAFPIQPDGTLGDHTAFDIHTGHSIDPVRQTGTYPHCIMVDPTNRFALVPDLGLDKLFVYRFDAKLGTLTANDPPFATIKPGSGPRHVRFHPNGKWLYLITEMGGTVIAFNWDSTAGTLSQFQSISTLPENFTGQNTSAEIVIHPNGKFLFASNRGPDTIAVFAIDPSTGMLSLVEMAPTLGKAPRDFTLDPTGKWLICTNQQSDNAVVFSVDDKTGKLTPSGSPIPIPAPCGIQFVPASAP
jgi:6-phosphogluconolactonase